MDEPFGLICGNCGAFHPLKNEVEFFLSTETVRTCGSCGEDMILKQSVSVSGYIIKEDHMEQSKSYTCKACSALVPKGHKFCGSCGATVPESVLEQKVESFLGSDSQAKAKLVLIRGTAGQEGKVVALDKTDHVVGQGDALLTFPKDPFVSAKHANFFYRNGKLFVRDEASVNGVYLRIKEPTLLEAGDQFICGEQVLRVENGPADTAGPNPDQTYFFSSPKKPAAFKITHVLRGGVDGTASCARDGVVSIGREGADLNFPDDLFMSGTHASVNTDGAGKLMLTDVGSRNGTFVRLRTEKELNHGDYVFVGQQLIRVEQVV